MSEPSGKKTCPVCSKPVISTKEFNRFAPFCSRRCADLDLGKWLKGGYAIPGPPEEEQTPDPIPQPPEDE